MCQNCHQTAPVERVMISVPLDEYVRTVAEGGLLSGELATIRRTVTALLPQVADEPTRKAIKEAVGIFEPPRDQWHGFR